MRKGMKLALSAGLILGIVFLNFSVAGACDMEKYVKLMGLALRKGKIIESPLLAAYLEKTEKVKGTEKERRIFFTVFFFFSEGKKVIYRADIVEEIWETGGNFSQERQKIGIDGDIFAAYDGRPEGGLTASRLCMKTMNGS
jgi:hypothetical protein